MQAMVSRSSLDGRWVRTATEIERYFASIDLSPGPGFCNPWTGGFFDSGYPRFSLSNARRSSVRAHRYGWQLLRGPIPPRLLVCHTCDWLPCMNPLHWILGTNAFNLADMVAKGRSLTGSDNPASKLTEADVRVIKRELLPQVAVGRGYTRAGQLTLRDIASRYDVTDGVIASIRAGRTWTHVR
jgi:hypothetical protein